MPRPDIPPCPFCGEAGRDLSPVRFDLPEHEARFQVRCHHCGAMGPPDLSREGAVEAWGKREGVRDAAT